LGVGPVRKRGVFWQQNFHKAGQVKKNFKIALDWTLEMTENVSWIHVV